MRKILLLALIVAGLTTGLAARRQATVEVVEVGAEEIRYAYDAAALKPYVLRDLLQISPFHSIVPPALELCIDGDADYRVCGTRALGAQNFFANAEINLRKGRELLSGLDGLNTPASLRPALQYHRRGVAFWSCLERARLAYYRGDNNALRARCDSVEASVSCPDWLKKASAARGDAERDELAKSGWHNCMNSAFHDRYGKYPLAAWRAFLKEFRIQETVLTNP